MMERDIVSNDSLEVADDDDEISPLPSSEQHLAAVAVVKRMSETYNLHSKLHAQLFFLKCSFGLKRANNKTQAIIDQRFSKNEVFLTFGTVQEL